MSKLLDMFTQARRGLSGNGIGFLGKSKGDMKPRAAAIVVEYTAIDAGGAEAATKAGSDGLLFAWKGKDELETLKEAIDAARASNEKIVCGLRLTDDLDALSRESLEEFKEQGINYIVLPLQAPARLLGLHVKELDKVLTVPMPGGDLQAYLLLIRSLSAFDTIAAVTLDFGLSGDIGQISIEDVLQYRAVREAVRFPALVKIDGQLDEADAYTLTALGVQAVILDAGASDTQTSKAIAAVREVMEKVHQEEKDNVQGGVKLG